MKQRSKVALIVFAIFYVSFGLFLAFFQERIIYQPGGQDFSACKSLEGATEIRYRNTRMYVKDTDKPTAVLYHGNAGSACDRALYADIFTQAGYGYIIVEYSGYSNDERRPSHELVKANVRDVIAFINERRISNIAVVGESIGTGVAAYHASLSAPEKLLLISPFSSLSDIAQNRFWFYPTSLLVNNAFDTVALLGAYRNPVTIIHGRNDSIIPHALGEKLYASLQSDKYFVTIEGADHNDLFLFPETYRAILNFFIFQNY